MASGKGLKSRYSDAKSRLPEGAIVKSRLPLYKNTEARGGTPLLEGAEIGGGAGHVSHAAGGARPKARVTMVGRPKSRGANFGMPKDAVPATRRRTQTPSPSILGRNNDSKNRKRRISSTSSRRHSLPDESLYETALEDLDITLYPYECPCCFNAVPFEYLVQCTDGHLFCIECLQRYVHEAVYGSTKGSLTCLSEGCKQVFSESQLLRALPDGLKARLEERIQEEEINVANIENFFRCSFCNYGAEVVGNEKYFSCANPTCMKITCLLCSVEFDKHVGLRCNEIEQEDETKIRKEYEERMACAKIRKCPKCHAKFTKEEGCNKIVCRCGTTMCYLCRELISGYRHFCGHGNGNDPGTACRVCNLCRLFTNCEEDDELAIREIKASAKQARRNFGFEEDKEIGVPMKKTARK